MQWKHITREENVADDVSPGVLVKDLNGRWKSGPEFLSKPEKQWPQKVLQADEKEVSKERRNTKVVCSTTTSQKIIDCKTFSSWRKLARVTARIQKIGKKIQAKRAGTNETNSVVNDGSLPPEDLKRKEMYWIKQAQNKPSLPNKKFL